MRKVTRKTGRVVDVACGQYSSFLVTESGSVIGFGLNNCYQMGYHDREVRYTPELIPITDPNDGKAVKVKKISSGMHHTIFLSDTGKFFSKQLIVDIRGPKSDYSGRAGRIYAPFDHDQTCPS